MSGQEAGGRNNTAVLDPIAEFREDHRKVRDGVLAIIDALQSRNITEARRILGGLNTLAGPHFRYEEEALYPVLKRFLGEYVDQLIREHNDIIATARGCSDLLQKDKLSDKEFAEAAKAARAILVHVSNCDGLAILSERLRADELADLGAKFAEARKKGVAMLDWAANIRNN